MEQVLLFFLLIPSLWLDLRYKRIPNVLVLPFIPLALLLHIIIGEGVLFSLAGMGLAFIILFPLFVLRVLAGGDVKLCLAIGAFVGWELLLESLLYALLIGLPLVLAYALYRVGWQGFKATFSRYGLILGSRRYLAPVEGEMAGLKVPYGPALALGTALAVLLNHFNIFTLVS